MNAKLLYAVTAMTAVLAAGSAFAEDGTPDYPKAYASPLARADVRAETIAALRSGAVQRNEYDLNQLPASERGIGPTLLSRAQVRGETIEARRLGLIPQGESPAVVPTAAELELVRLAGVRAVANQHASASK